MEDEKKDKPSDTVSLTIKSLDEVSHLMLSDFYAPTEDGRFRLKIPDAVEKVRLEEFRDNNISLNKQKAELESQVAAYRSLGDDPVKLTEELEALRKLRQRVDDKDLIDRGGFDKAVEQRVAEMKAAADGQIRALSDALKKTEAERDASRAEYRRTLIHGEIAKSALNSGVEPEAIPDVLARAEREGWTLSERGRVVLVRDGEIVFGENGVDPLSAKEWVSRHLREQARHLFADRRGGGAPGSAAPGGARNPWTKENWNLSDQARIARENGLPKAQQMAEAAGSFLGATHPPGGGPAPGRQSAA